MPNGRCNGIRDCLYGEDEYCCPPKELSEQLVYRSKKLDVKENHSLFDKQTYPPSQLTKEISLYFGHKCQFFSDRITIVAHLDLDDDFNIANVILR